MSFPSPSSFHFRLRRAPSSAPLGVIPSCWSYRSFHSFLSLCFLSLFPCFFRRLLLISGTGHWERPCLSRVACERVPLSFSTLLPENGELRSPHHRSGMAPKTSGMAQNVRWSSSKSLSRRSSSPLRCREKESQHHSESPQPRGHRRKPSEKRLGRLLRSGEPIRLGQCRGGGGPPPSRAPL